MYPLLLEPFYKDYIWGGERLKSDFSKNTDLSPLAESWECSVHPDGKSKVKNGKYKGKTLDEIIKHYPEILGKKHQDSGFPILVKLIDAKENLSIQVHPDDEYAKEYEGGSLGKFEAWYVLDAAPQTHICYGLKRKVSDKDLKSAIENGKVENIVQKISIAKDEVYFIEPGRIHSIGAGALIAEIQENSNVTYRLYDYKRQGNIKRELHIEKAVEVADLNGSLEPVQPMRVLRYNPGIAKEMLCRCKYFEVHRIMVNVQEELRIIYSTDALSFKVILIIEGSGSVCFNSDGVVCNLSIKKGDCIFIPADSQNIFLQGKFQMLEIGC